MCRRQRQQRKQQQRPQARVVRRLRRRCRNGLIRRGRRRRRLRKDDRTCCNGLRRARRLRSRRYRRDGFRFGRRRHASDRRTRTAHDRKIAATGRNEQCDRFALLLQVDLPAFRPRRNDHVTKHVNRSAARPAHCVQMPRNRHVRDLTRSDARLERCVLLCRKTEFNAGPFEDASLQSDIALELRRRSDLPDQRRRAELRDNVRLRERRQRDCGAQEQRTKHF